MKPKMKSIKILDSMDEETMTKAMQHNDAIEAIRDGVSRTDYINMHKARCHDQAAEGYDSALNSKS